MFRERSAIDDVVMNRAAGTAHLVRRFRSVAEKRRIIDLTLQLGASVALVTLVHGLRTLDGLDVFV